MNQSAYEREKHKAATAWDVSNCDYDHGNETPPYQSFCEGYNAGYARAQAEINKEPIAIAHIKACQRNEEYLDKIDRLTALLRECEAVLHHPDEDLLSCECGYFGEDDEETGMSICLKCAMQDMRGKLRKELGECVCGEINARNCPVHQGGAE